MPSARSPELTDEKRQQVVKLYKDGLSTSKITEQTGVGRGTLYWILEQSGVETNRVRRSDADSQSLQQQVFDQQLEIGRLLGRIEALEKRVSELASK